MVEGEHPHISAMVDMVPSDDGVAVVFHPDARQRVVGDLVVLVHSLGGHSNVLSGGGNILYMSS